MEKYTSEEEKNFTAKQTEHESAPHDIALESDQNTMGILHEEAQNENEAKINELRNQIQTQGEAGSEKTDNSGEIFELTQQMQQLEKEIWQEYLPGVDVNNLSEDLQVISDLNLVGQAQEASLFHAKMKELLTQIKPSRVPFAQSKLKGYIKAYNSPEMAKIIALEKQASNLK